MNQREQKDSAAGQPAPRRIVLVISSLGGGGAERVMALLAGEWVRRGVSVSLVTLDDSPDAYNVAPAVERVRLGLAANSRSALEGLRNNWRRLRALRQAVISRHPDCVISFMDRTNVLALLALKRTKIPVIVSERVDPRYYPPGKAWAWLRQRLYPAAHCVVVQTDAVAHWAREFVPADKVRVIPNPIVIPPDAGSESPPEWMPAGRTIAAMGRLDPQKGFDLLLNAFSKVASDFPAVSLVIMGEGPERANLETLAANLSLQTRVTMPGRVGNPWPVLSHCELFVLSSRFEGFPNALLEAMALGSAVISFACPSGPAEMIQDGVNGLLVEPENPDALAAAMAQLLNDDVLRNRLAEAAGSDRERYSISRITDQWENLCRTRF